MVEEIVEEVEPQKQDMTKRVENTGEVETSTHIIEVVEKESKSTKVPLVLEMATTSVVAAVATTEEDNGTLYPWLLGVLALVTLASFVVIVRREDEEAQSEVDEYEIIK